MFRCFNKGVNAIYDNRMLFVSFVILEKKSLVGLRLSLVDEKSATVEVIWHDTSLPCIDSNLQR